ncbi:MAG: hypothetical protein JWP88_1058, partial [Flaviaesturariibacter sp.]|nr:hypothetical protein [Flaviaesturariibacter sp.]
LKASLKKKLGNQWITDLFRVNTEEGTVYFACLETGDSKVILQSAGTKKWTVYSKEVKL